MLGTRLFQLFLIPLQWRSQGGGGKRGNCPPFFRIPPPTCHTRMHARRKNTAGPRDYNRSRRDSGGWANTARYILATATEEHRVAERSNAEIAIGTQNTGGRAFSAHTRAPADRNASFTISTYNITGRWMQCIFGKRKRANCGTTTCAGSLISAAA